MEPEQNRKVQKKAQSIYFEKDKVLNYNQVEIL